MPDGSLGQPNIGIYIYPKEGGECEDFKQAEIELMNIKHATTPRIPDGYWNRTKLKPNHRNLMNQGLVTFGAFEALRRLTLSTHPMSKRGLLVGLLRTLPAALLATMAIDFNTNPAYAYDQPNSPTNPGIIQIYCGGGKDFRFATRYPGPTNNKFGGHSSPPTGMTAAPANFQMVPDGKGGGGLVHNLQKNGNKIASHVYRQNDNGHQTSTRRAWTGSDDTMSADLPSQLAWTRGNGEPFALVNGGNVAFPGMLVVPSSVTDINAMAILADPNTGQIVPESLEEYLRVQLKKHVALHETGHEVHKDAEGKDSFNTILPTAQNIGKDRNVAQSAGDDLKEMLAIVEKFNAQNNPIGKFLIILTELMKDGGVASASTSIGGHDTHGSKDGAQQMALDDILVKGLDAGHAYAESVGYHLQTQRVSEFSRKPSDPNNLNNGDPSTHNNITEVNYQGAGVPPGGITLGVLDDKGTHIIGEEFNYADEMIYRMQQANLSKVPNVNITDMTGPSVVQDLMKKKTALVMPQDPDEIREHTRTAMSRRRFFTGWGKGNRAA